jgi:hypothetical protein
MRILYVFPFLLVLWTMCIIAYEDHKDESFGGIVFCLLIVTIFVYWAVKKYREPSKKKLDVANIIAVNIGLLPLLYSNLLLTPIVLQGKEINESGMVYVLVLIYSPLLYGGSLLAMVIFGNLVKILQR